MLSNKDLSMSIESVCKEIRSVIRDERRDLDARFDGLELQLETISEKLDKPMIQIPADEPVNTTATHAPAIPPGWEPVLDGPRATRIGDYAYSMDKWVPNPAGSWATLVISPTININMDLHPKDIVAWSMDSDGEWFGYVEIPKEFTDRWDTRSLVQRDLFPSEYPTNFTGGWRDSLIVRPEAMNGGEL